MADGGERHGGMMTGGGMTNDGMAGPGDGEGETSPEAIEAGRLLFTQPCTFIMGVAAIAQLPPANLPEVAFVGRSNVGKSSLINALTGQRQLARTSNTPGRTQQINLFDLGGRLILADLPGYGFAKAPKPTVETWHRLIQAYLKGRPSLRLVNILIDARHGKKDSDQAYMTMLAEAAVAYRVVLTKADLVRPAALKELVDEIEADLAHKVGAHPDPLVTSVKDQNGLAELRASLALLAA